MEWIELERLQVSKLCLSINLWCELGQVLPLVVLASPFVKSEMPSTSNLPSNLPQFTHRELQSREWGDLIKVTQ